MKTLDEEEEVAKAAANTKAMENKKHPDIRDHIDRNRLRWILPRIHGKSRVKTQTEKNVVQ